MKPELPSEQKPQEDKAKESPVSPGASAAQRCRARLQKFTTYFAGDMAPFGKWMESA